MIITERMGHGLGMDEMSEMIDVRDTAILTKEGSDIVHEVKTIEVSVAILDSKTIGTTDNLPDRGSRQTRTIETGTL